MSAGDPDSADGGQAITHEARILGCLLGTAVGDALLLPYEGLSPTTIAKRFPDPLRHQFWFGRGMLSDDTELTVFVAQAWIRSQGNSDRFIRAFAWRIRWWILCLPAGMGRATLRSSLRLWCGFSPQRSGVVSAGNGAAMRCALLGVLLANDAERRKQWVTALTLVTHRDPRAVTGSLAVTEASAWAVRQEPLDELWSNLAACGDDAEWGRCLGFVRTAYENDYDLAWLTHELGSTRGISGFVYHTVPAALFVWLRYRGSGEAALTILARAGGDTDTVGAITGALIGSDAGVGAFPDHWITQIADWPLSLSYVRQLAAVISRNEAVPNHSLPWWWWPIYPVRSLIFFMRVLIEGLWRLVRR